ncbi:VanZ family protein [Natronomonas halophila]|uniref:VanZ family protein n=1 Tax=Natronomonas halophila TaxID=2747817 RepID=UPI0015B59CFE|nr:VanZ family protein [Natronomonas halophila]QLD86884.1 VanZ family protein [Natronomonas halophila]
MNRTLPVAPRPLRYAGVLACAVVILYASVTAVDDGVPTTLFGIGTTVYLHVIAYAGFTGAIGYARLSADRRVLLLAAGLSTLYGIGIELLQGTIPYRTMTLLDVGINAFGALLGATLWRLTAPVFGAER